MSNKAKKTYVIVCIRPRDGMETRLKALAQAMTLDNIYHEVNKPEVTVSDVMHEILDEGLPKREAKYGLTKMATKTVSHKAAKKVS